MTPNSLNLVWQSLELLDVIESTGLVSKLTKTQTLLAIEGSCQAQLLAKHTRRTKDGWFLCLPRNDGSFPHIRLVKQSVYLGVVISKMQPCVRTQMQRECPPKVAEVASCVFSILMYGIIDTGVTAKGSFPTSHPSMTREIYQDHPYRTGRSHLDFFRHPGLPIVLRRFSGRVRTLQAFRPDRDW